MPKPDTSANAKVEQPEMEKRYAEAFTAEYKLFILQQADACQHGELGALLRRKSPIPTKSIPDDADQGTVEKWVNFPTLQRAIAKVT